MSVEAFHSDPDEAEVERPAAPREFNPAVAYPATLAMVAAATGAAGLIDHYVSSAGVALVFVLPVLVSASLFGWAPALLASALGAGTYDYFFTAPRFTFVMSDPVEILTFTLLLAVAVLVSSIASQSRRRAVQARRAAGQAEALHALARSVLEGADLPTAARLAADALTLSLSAPAIVMVREAGRMRVVGASRGAHASDADRRAADWALANHMATRGATFPFEQAKFDFWPFADGSGREMAVGARLSDKPDGRPEGADRDVNLVVGYLSSPR